MLKKSLKLSLIILIGLSLLFSAYVYLSAYHPDDIQSEHVFYLGETPELKAGQRIKILSWNIQFLAGNQDNHFFFDGGSDPWPPKSRIDKILTEIAGILKEEDPDLILLQEVDDGSLRTYERDQLQDLLGLLPQTYTCHTSAFYWKAWFIPHPAIMGSAGMKLSIISKYKITRATRYALSPITTQNIVMRQFNPKRAMLEALLPLSNGKFLHAVNTHLSAFAQGSDTMEKQVSQVDQLLTQISRSGSVGFIGGDFNLIPPGEAYKRLSEYNKGYYNPSGTEIEILFKKYLSVPALADLVGDDYTKWYTNMVTNANPKIPDKTIDYIFFSPGSHADSYYVRSKNTIHISDHLPLVFYLTIPD
jgi:endonuclease/exonuclease/phosphatase family metal-dependent hydrolase